MKSSYDTSWLPPAPFLLVQLASLAERSETITVQAKLDDVLNRLRLLLDGPALTTEILKS